MAHQNQEPRTNMLQACAYAIGGVVLGGFAYSAADMPFTTRAQSHAEVVLSQIDACERGGRSLDVHEVVDPIGAPVGALFCGEARVVFAEDGSVPDWNATRLPAEALLNQSLLLPDAEELDFYYIVGAAGAMLGLGAHSSRKNTIESKNTNPDQHVSS